jgi:hypothetical protein
LTKQAITGSASFMAVMPSRDGGGDGLALKHLVDGGSATAHRADHRRPPPRRWPFRRILARHIWYKTTSHACVRSGGASALNKKLLLGSL